MGGEQNGFTLELAAARARGDANGLSIIQHNTHVSASDTLTIISRNDTTLMGAQARGETIKAVVGGNLTIESLQDSDTYISNQSSGGFSASICIPPICYGNTVSATISLSKGNIDSTFKSVTEQSGVYAGVGGFDITVGHNTGLKGAVIASRADARQNTLTTGTLTTSDVQNLAEYSSDSSSMSLSYGGGSAMKSLLSNVAANAAGNVAPEKAGDAQGLTRSAIGAATINFTGDQAAVTGTSAEETIANLNRDTDNANGCIDKIFDLEQIEKEQAYQKALSEVAQLAAPMLYKRIGDELEGQPSEVKVAVHALIGGLPAKAMGGEFASGAAGAGAAELAMDLFGNELLGKDRRPIEEMSPEERKAFEDRKALVQLVGLLVSKVAASAAGADDSASNAVAFTAKLAVENNWLKHQETLNLAKYKAACDVNNGNKAACDQAFALQALDNMRNVALFSACTTGTLPQCQAQRSLDPAAEAYYVANFDEIVAKRISAQSGVERYINISDLGDRIDASPQYYAARAAATRDGVKGIYNSPLNLVEVVTNLFGAAIPGQSDYVSFLDPIKGKYETDSPAGFFGELIGAYGISAAVAILPAILEGEQSLLTGGAAALGTKPSVVVVRAKATVDGAVFEDVNQSARLGAKRSEPTLIADRVAAKEAKNAESLPNGNMATAHAEIGAIQQAFNAGKTNGANMTLVVEGKAVCGYCRGDIAAAAEKAGLKSLTVSETATGKTLYWKTGMRSLKTLPEGN